MNWKTDLAAWVVGLVVVAAITIEAFALHAMHHQPPSWTRQLPPVAAATRDRSGIHLDWCQVDGKSWKPRGNTCYMADEPKP